MQKNLLFSIPFLWCILISSAQTKQNAIDSVDVLVSLANKYIIKTDFEQALNYSIKAVNLAHISKDKNAQAEAYTSLGNSYQMVEDVLNAEKHFKEALRLGTAVDNLYVLIAASNGLGNVYSKNIKTIDKAIEYYELSAKHALKSKEPERVFIASLNTATLFLEYKKPDKANIYIKSAKKSYEDYESKIPLYDVTLDYVQGIYYKQKNEYVKALYYLDKSQKVSEDNELILDLIEIHKAKSEIYQGQGEFTLAIAHIKKEQYYKDLNSDAEKAQQIQEINTKFKISEYERELEASSKEKEILAQLTVSKNKTIIITGLSIVMLLGVIILMFSGYKKRKANYELKLHNQALKEAKNNAERLTELKSKFISRVSHELRTPLYGVVGITSMLQKNKTLVKESPELINSLKFSGDHLINLVNNVLKISQIDSNNIELNYSNTNIRLLINNVVNSLQFQAKQKNNELNLFVAKEVKAVYKMDSVRLSEVLINLITNAIKFTVNGNILVTVALENKSNTNRLYFEVKDTGKGILEDHINSVFDKFIQVNDEENTYEGAGLGLPIVKHLLKLMGSDIHLKSTINKGSIFSFVLELEEGKTKSTSNKKRTINISRKRILIAEDNRISQMVTSKLIKLMGHDCVIAKNGVEALQMAEEGSFDLILMDLNMPLMNGYDATEKIKSICPNLKIIALTATEITEVKDKCFSSGMIEVINKPLGKLELEHVINRYLFEEHFECVYTNTKAANNF